MRPGLRLFRGPGSFGRFNLATISRARAAQRLQQNRVRSCLPAFWNDLLHHSHRKTGRGFRLATCAQSREQNRDSGRGGLNSILHCAHSMRRFYRQMIQSSSASQRVKKSLATFSIVLEMMIAETITTTPRMQAPKIIGR